jgi:hypothetical protein
MAQNKHNEKAKKVDWKTKEMPSHNTVLTPLEVRCPNCLPHLPREIVKSYLIGVR